MLTPGEPDVLGEFRVAARTYSGRAAIVDNGDELSYAGLEAEVLAVARRLDNRPGAVRQRLSRPGVVAVAATHSTDTITGLLGVWSAGGTYCPIDPSFPERRREAMLAAAGCHVALDPRSPGGVEVLSPLNEGGLGLPGGDPAYILFTSGSTGEPKPVLTPALAISTVVRSLRELFALTPTDRVLQFASLNWDTCFEEILPALTSGACLVFHKDAYSGSFPRFLRMLATERITVLDLPTAFWHELVNYLVEEGAGLAECVRLVIIGGEAVSAARLADWRALPTDHVRLLNTYGCTETTLITHAAELHGPLVASVPTIAGTAGDRAARVPIGTALSHVVERVTDDGELLIGGPSLAAGYRDLPQETDARFTTVRGERFFRTGDRVSRLGNGMLVHEGRIDGELKIRGIRVDPAEVEAHIANHPAVGAVAVTGVRVADHTVLAAHVVARPTCDDADLPAAIVEFLRVRVPAHLIPSRITVVAGLVYTASGKVDRHRIKEALA